MKINQITLNICVLFRFKIVVCRASIQLLPQIACVGFYTLAKRTRIIRNTRKVERMKSTLDLKAVTYMICLSKMNYTVRVNIDALLGASL